MSTIGPVVATGTLNDAYLIQQAIESAVDGDTIQLKNAESGLGVNGFLMSDFRSIVRSASRVTHNGKNYTCKSSHNSGTTASEPGVGGSWATYWTDNGAGSGNNAWEVEVDYYLSNFQCLFNYNNFPVSRSINKVRIRFNDSCRQPEEKE